jgi:hypothetical protein
MAPRAGQRWGRAREAALLVAVHAALVVALWLTSVVVYALAFTPTRQPVWIAFDALLVAGCLWFVKARRDRIGLSSLGERKALRLAAAAACSLGFVALAQAVVRDANGIWLDESNYLATVRGGIVRDGLYPFNMRWLEPFLAGAWNALPLDDAEALKALNFGGLVTTGALLVLLLVRIGAPFRIALAAPVFLMSSYLGVYAGINRLVLDPFNYAMFAVLFHALLRREHGWLFGLALLVTAFNSEKAVYWIPSFALVEVVRAGGGRRAWIAALGRTARCCGPAVAYLVLMRLYLIGSDTVSELIADNVHLMSFTWLAAGISGEAKHNSFQILWFPFGSFTIFALLGFTLAPRALRPVLVLLGPIMLSVFIANDTQRMLAYAFIVYLPFGYLYFARALADLPARLAAAVFALLTAIVACEHYLVAALAPLREKYHLGPLSPGRLKLVLSTTEILLVVGVVFVHYAFYRPDPPPPAAAPATGA